jgi:hypothetical protein
MQPSPVPAFEAMTALLAQAARLRQHLEEATVLLGELSLDLARSTAQAAKLTKHDPLLKLYQAGLRKQIQESTLDITRTEKLLGVIARLD